jgi:hypothetical protein
MDSAGLVLAVLLGALPQEPRAQEPPIIELPPARVEEPRPAFPAGPGFSIRTVALRPRWELATREFDVGAFSGEVNFGDMASFDRTTMALEATFDSGPWVITASAFQQRHRAVLDQDMTFEQHAFRAGTIVQGSAFFGTLDAFRRIDVAGGPEEPFHLSLLVGINISKIAMRLKDDTRVASEGFSALWPLPAVGVEARVSLSDQLSAVLSARGTRFRYTNPFQLDGGGSQDVRYLFGRFDASLQWALSGTFSVDAGYTGLDAYIEDASAEDTDSADLKAGGVHAGLSVRF